MNEIENWMDEEHGIPHKDGLVRFYLVGFEEDVFGYLGWFDMTDWDKGWKKVWAEANKKRPSDEFQVLRHDQLQDLARNVQWAFEEALEDKDERTWLWYIKQERLKKEQTK